MDQNSIKEEINSRLKTGYACCHLVQNLLSSSFLSKNIRMWVLNLVTHIEGGMQAEGV